MTLLLDYHLFLIFILTILIKFWSSTSYPWLWTWLEISQTWTKTVMPRQHILHLLHSVMVKQLSNTGHDDHSNPLRPHRGMGLLLEALASSHHPVIEEIYLILHAIFMPVGLEVEVIY